MGAAKSKVPMTIPGVPAAIPAASVILLAPSRQEFDFGFKMLMVKRTATMKFMPNSYVFPGGKVDPADEALALNTDEVPDVYSHGGFRIAALREMAEEVGITMDRLGTFSSTKYSRFTPQGAQLLAPFAHWVTPIQEKKRFDTFFFVALGRNNLLKIPLTVQPEEIADAVWISPHEALERHAQKDSDFTLPPPTFLMVHKLSTYKSPVPVLHEHQVAFGQTMDSDMPRIQPILRIVDGVFEMHLPKGFIHLPEGVHEFPGNYAPKTAVPEGQEPVDFWRVKIGSGSELIDPRTNSPIASIPEGGAKL